MLTKTARPIPTLEVGDLVMYQDGECRVKEVYWSQSHQTYLCRLEAWYDQRCKVDICWDGDKIRCEELKKIGHGRFTQEIEYENREKDKEDEPEEDFFSNKCPTIEDKPDEKLFIKKPKKKYPDGWVAKRFKMHHIFINHTAKLLTHTQQCIWFVLWDEVKGETARISQRRVGKLLKMSTKTVYSGIKKLEELGIIEVSFRGHYKGDCSSYIVHGTTSEARKS